MKKLILSLIFLSYLAACSSSKKVTCTYFHKSKEELIKYKPNMVLFDFLDPKPNEKIADIGAGGFQWEAKMMILRDSLTFYAQDIDTLCTNTKELNKALENIKKLRNAPSSGKIIRVIGNSKSTNLESNFFDKAMIINTFHEFSDRQAMINETLRILKSGGKLYIEERLPQGKKLIHQGCKKPMIDEKELVELMEKNGFKLLDIRSMKYSFPDQVYCFQKL